MALSNWDTFVVDEQGKPCRGRLVSFAGVEVEFYKNWLYIRDEKAWDEKDGWAKPYVAEIQQGEVHYKDVQITAIRGPKNGVYAVIESTGNYPTEEERKAGKKPDRRILIGVACYGFGDNDEWVGVQPADIAFLKEWVHGLAEDSFPRFVDEVRAIPLDAGLRFNQGDAFFADHLGDDIPATKPGEAETPVMGRICAAMTAETEKKT